MKTAEMFDIIESLPADKKSELEGVLLSWKAELASKQHTDIKPGFGGGKGIIGYMADDFDEPLDDFKEYM